MRGKITNIHVERLEALSKKLCLKIEEKLGDRSLPEYKENTVVYAIARGGVFPGLYISHYFKIPFRTIHISRYEGYDQTGAIQVHQRLPDINEFSDKTRIIVAEDIVDRGVTVEYVMNYFKSLNELNQIVLRIYSAAVIVNEHSDFIPDFYAYKNPDDWIVFPYEEAVKNQPT